MCGRRRAGASKCGCEAAWIAVSQRLIVVRRCSAYSLVENREPFERSFDCYLRIVVALSEAFHGPIEIASNVFSRGAGALAALCLSRASAGAGQGKCCNRGGGRGSEVHPRAAGRR